MATKLSDPIAKELSLIFKSFGGKEWAPRNPEARLLSVKGATDESRREKSFLGDLWEKVTGLVSSKAASADDALRNAINYASYDVLGSLVYQLQWDLYAVFTLDDDVFSPDQKKEAVQRVFDGFTAEIAKILPLFLGEADLSALASKCAEKAGARHSQGDKTAIDAIEKAHKKMTKHLATVGDNLKKLGAGTDSSDEPAGSQDDAKKAEAVKALAAFVPGELVDGGYPANMAEYRALSEKAQSQDSKPYGEVEYADPVNGKYPIDTEEHVRKAWSFINQEKSAAEYSEAELAKVKDCIKAACEKAGIKIDESQKGLETPIATPPTDVAAIVTQEIEKAKASIKSEFDAALVDQVAKAKVESDKLIEANTKLQDTVKALIADGRKPSATGAVTTIGSGGEATNATGEPAVKAEAVKKGMTLVEGTKALLAANRT